MCSACDRVEIPHRAEHSAAAGSTCVRSSVAPQQPVLVSVFLGTDTESKGMGSRCWEPAVSSSGSESGSTEDFDRCWCKRLLLDVTAPLFHYSCKKPLNMEIAETPPAQRQMLPFKTKASTGHAGADGVHRLFGL